MLWSRDTQHADKTALVLSGGGARAAYQVGALQAIANLQKKEAPNPFPIICGTSAGAINATALAIYAPSFREGVFRMLKIWKNLETEQIFRADAMGIMKSGAHWLTAMGLAGLGKYNPHSLLDTSPLRELMGHILPCDHIQTSIDNGYLEALSITASGYSSGQSVSFFQGVDHHHPWKRARRVGCPARINVEHLMASSAIPFIFPATRINREYFGDGSMRQIAPLSPAIHLGANRLLVIGVRREEDEPIREEVTNHPSIGQMAGHILNSIFLDSLSIDLERLERINKTTALLTAKKLKGNDIALKPIEVLVISPSVDIGELSTQFIHCMPRPVRYLLKGIGALNDQDASLVSYLLFEKAFCRKLIALGYKDAMKQKEEIKAFMSQQDRDR